MIIGFVMRKGGVGKSTLATHATVYLHDRGEPVAHIDADASLDSSKWLKRMEVDIPVYGSHSVDEIVALARELDSKFDYVILDAPGSNDEAARTLLCVCHVAVMPCGPSYLDMDSLEETLALVKTARALRDGTLPHVFFVGNQTKKRQTLSKELVELIDNKGIPRAKHTVRELTAIEDAPGQDTVVTREKKRAAKNDINAVMEEILAYAKEKAA